MPVPGLTHFEGTAIQVTFAGRRVIDLAAYISPSCPLIGTDLSTCFGRELPVLMAVDFNVKHVDWNSRLSTRRGKVLRAYTDEYSCLIFGPGSPKPNTYNPSVSPDILDIVITNKLSIPVYLITYSALSSDHLPVIIVTTCSSSFHNPPDPPHFSRNDWAKFQTHLDHLVPFVPELHNEKAIDTCVENFSGAVLGAQEATTPKCRPRDNPRLSLPA